MQEIFDYIGIIGATLLSILFAGVSAYFSIRRGIKRNNGGASGTEKDNRLTEGHYNKLEKLYEDAVSILQKKKPEGPGDSNPR